MGPQARTRVLETSAELISAFRGKHEVQKQQRQEQQQEQGLASAADGVVRVVTVQQDDGNSDAPAGAHTCA